MPILRRAGTELKKIDLDDEGSYIQVAPEITKGDFNRLVRAMPEVKDGDDISPVQATELTSDFFDVFVRGWSLDTEPTVAEYLALPRDAAEAIDTKLMEYFSGLNPGEPERKKRGS